MTAFLCFRRDNRNGSPLRASDVSAPDVKVPASEAGASASVPGVSVSAPEVKSTGEVDVKAPEVPSVDAKKPKGSILGGLIRKHSSRSKVEVCLYINLIKLLEVLSIGYVCCSRVIDSIVCKWYCRRKDHSCYRREDSFRPILL